MTHFAAAQARDCVHLDEPPERITDTANTLRAMTLAELLAALRFYNAAPPFPGVRLAFRVGE